MASVIERSDSKKHEERYRVRFCRRKREMFSLTFDDWVSACKWVEEHEEKYYKNPESYFKWRIELSEMMRRKHLKVYEHIIRPVIRSKPASPRRS